MTREKNLAGYINDCGIRNSDWKERRQAAGAGGRKNKECFCLSCLLPPAVCLLPLLQGVFGFASGLPCCVFGWSAGLLVSVGFVELLDEVGTSATRWPLVRSKTALRRNCSIVQGGGSPPRYLLNHSRCAV